MRHDACPPKPTLSSYFLGKLAELENSEVAEHLADCPTCQETVRGLEDETDGWVRDMSREWETEAGDESYRSLIASLKAIKDQTSQTWLEPTVQTAHDPGLQPNQMLRQYEIKELLGHGGMGAVYRARHVNLQRGRCHQNPPPRKAL